MLKKEIPLLYLLIILFLVSCKGSEETKGQNDPVVKVNTSGIFEPLLVERNFKDHVGNFLLGASDKILTYTLTNQSEFDLTDIQFLIDDLETAGMTFVKDSDGANRYPGVGGTCTTVIKPSRSCTIKIVYSPQVPGAFSQKITINYTNLVNAEVIYDRLSVLAGNPASLVFVNDTTTYNLGIVERTFPNDRYYQELIVENRGGLPAVNFTVLIDNVPNTGAYRITENNCPKTLGLLQSCRVLVEFSSMNFSSSAPDGEQDRLNYEATIRFEYERDSDGTLATLNGRISTLSTSIQAEMERGGIADITFPELVVGNFTSKPFRFLNTGYKEAIIFAIHLSGPDGNRIGSCVRNGSSTLECRDPESPLDIGARLSLSDLPFRVVDSNDCLSEIGLYPYSRTASGDLSVDGLRYVDGQSLETSGETCNFQLTFHPSVEYTTDGHWNGLEVDVEYDSTWKDKVVFRSTEDVFEGRFRVAQANYRAAGLIVNQRLRLDGTLLNRTELTSNLTFYNLGRLTLISDPAFRTAIDFNFVNIGGNEVQILKIEDGKEREITTQNQFLDAYYRNANHDSCNTLTRGGSGTCNVRLQLTPLASTLSNGADASNWENNLMFDTDAPNRLKTFTVFYTDGVNWEDDLTPRQPRTLTVTFTALLARAGFLVYDPVSPPNGDMGTHLHRTNAEYSFAVQNVGTGPIPFLRFVPGKDLLGTTPKAFGRIFPFEQIQKSPEEVLADGGPEVDLDCFDIFGPSVGPSSIPNAIIGANAPGVLNAGQRCSVSVRAKLRRTDILDLNDYDEFNDGSSTPYFYELDRKIVYDDPWQSWEQESDILNTNVNIVYYDGDGIEDVENNHYPELPGYGMLRQIGLPSQQDLGIRFRVLSSARLVIDKPWPNSSAVIQRPSFTLPAIPQDGWGSSVSAFSIDDLWNYAGVYDIISNFRAAAAIRSRLFLTTGGGGGSLEASSNLVHYNMHAGSFPAGGEYNFRFSLKNSGSFRGLIRSLSLVDKSPVDSSLHLLNGALVTQPNGSMGLQMVQGEEYVLQFRFTPDELDLGDHTAYLELSYETGVLIDGVPEIDNLRVKIIARAINSNYGQPSITYQDVLIDYDEFRNPAIIETLDSDIVDIVTGYNDAPSIEERISYRAIRGSTIYERKRFEVTNTNSMPIQGLTFFLKDSPVALSLRNSSGPDLGFQLQDNTCNNILLASGESCSFWIRFKAADAEPLLRSLTGVLSYRLGTNNQYTESMFNIELIAVDPAILYPVGINPTTVSDTVGNLIPQSYGINLGEVVGFSGTSPHLVLTDNPTITERSPIRIMNISSEKASFIAAYRDFVGNSNAVPDDSEDWVEIYNQRRLSVSASLGCFFGDDYNDDIPEDEKGFNSVSVEPCYLRPTYTAGVEYLSEEINSSENVHRIKFYNSQRSSVNFMNFFVYGFIEGNRSSRDGNFFNLETDSSGTLEINWNPMNPTNMSWGPIIGYRVYYSNRAAPVDNLFTDTSVLYIDVASTSAVLTGLLPMRQYYLRVVAIRSTGGKNYISRDRGWGRFSWIVPDTEHFYDFNSTSLVTKRLAPVGSNPYYGTRAGAITYCSSRVLRINSNGSNRNIGMKLISAPQYSAIASDESHTIADRPLSVLPQWIAGPNINILSIFGPEAEFSMSGNIGLKLYNKPCQTCNSLPYFEGGDPEFHPPGATVYVGGDTFPAFARCYISRP